MMALNIHEELRLIATTLKDHNIDYALTGGMAVALHGFPRATQDIDFMVREEDLDRVVSLLNGKGYTVPGGMIVLNRGKETECRIYRISKASGEDLLTLDLVLVTSVLEDIWEKRESYTVDDYELVVVSLDGLRKMKRLAGRPQDLADLDRLEEKPE